MKRKRGAPPEIAGLYVVAFAHVDKSVQFEQRHWLNVGGKWLGRVPCIAICQHFDKAEYTIQFCDSRWNSLGMAADYKTIKEAKERTERSYHGITRKWRNQTVPKRKAHAAYQAALKAESCSFCGRSPFDITTMIARTNVRICNVCVDAFHEAMRS